MMGICAQMGSGVAGHTVVALVTMEKPAAGAIRASRFSSALLETSAVVTDAALTSTHAHQMADALRLGRHFGEFNHHVLLGLHAW